MFKKNEKHELEQEVRLKKLENDFDLLVNDVNKTNSYLENCVSYINKLSAKMDAPVKASINWDAVLVNTASNCLSYMVPSMDIQDEAKVGLAVSYASELVALLKERIENE